jgi:hypothetical protein
MLLKTCHPKFITWQNHEQMHPNWKFRRVMFRVPCGKDDNYMIIARLIVIMTGLSNSRKRGMNCKTGDVGASTIAAGE